MKHLPPLFLAFLLLQCTNYDTPVPEATITTPLMVQSYKVSCTGFVEQECFLVKIGDDYPAGEWTYFYENIEGFDYLPGFVYDIRVEKIERDPIPQDVGRYRYVFLSLISKEPVD